MDHQSILKKISDNVRNQVIMNERLTVLRNEMQGLQSQQLRLQGQMDILVPAYKETTGRDLQTDVDTNEDIKKLIADAQEQGKRIAAGQPNQPIAVDMNANDAKAAAEGQGNGVKLRPVGNNKKVSEPTAVPQPGRSQEPVRIVIDDKAPQPGDDKDD